MRKFGGRVWLVGALAVGITVANVALNRIKRPKPLTMSSFTNGQVLPALNLVPLTESTAASALRPVPSGCRLIVLFNTTCPHCHTAALMEAGLADSVRMPVLWVSDTNDQLARTFAESLHPQSAIRYGGPEAFKKLKVRGVPTVFLVGADDRVVFSSAYSGRDTDHQVLRGMCPA